MQFFDYPLFYVERIVNISKSDVQLNTEQVENNTVNTQLRVLIAQTFNEIVYLHEHTCVYSCFYCKN